jgi:hypothetical protein
MKESVRREETRELGSLIERLENNLKSISSVNEKQEGSSKNIAGSNIDHLPVITSNSFVDSIFWKKESGS